MHRLILMVRRLGLASVVVLCTILLCAPLQPVNAQAAEAETILTLRNAKVDGKHGTVRFSADDLLAMRQHDIRTSNDYIDGVSEFRGPLAETVINLIRRAGAERARLIAANDYLVEIDIAELERFGAVLALTMDGARLARRDKGHIWLMYPMDDYPELENRMYNSRLIWQLEVIELF